jgi:prepilin peptidase CpaA
VGVLPSCQKYRRTVVILSLPANLNPDTYLDDNALMAWPAYITLAPLIVCLAIAAIIDARERRIPNWLTFGLILAGLARAAAAGSAPQFGHSLLGFLVGGSIPLVLFAISALGGGDVKLLAGIGAWLGAGPVILVMAVEAILGLIIVLTQAIVQRRTGAVLRNSMVIAASFASVGEVGWDNAIETGKACKSLNRPLPFAVPVFVATLIVLSLGN